jgi:light-regulated signal transduction histidine kinase (bacteriophytochrome)
VAAHDLKGPLRSINSFTQLLRRRLGDKVGDDEMEYFAYIQQSTYKLTVLIDDLLNFSRLGKAMGDAEPVDLNATMEQVKSNLYQDIKDKAAILHIGPLPHVNGHTSLLTQLFQNLVGNSLKFTHEGIAPVVSIKQVPGTAKRVHIVVEDNGIGIAPEDQARVFELFTRLHSDQAYRGSGVGLAACRKIVQHYDGKIWLTSTEGKGTQVHILL